MSDQTLKAPPADADFIKLATSKGFAVIVDECIGCGHVRSIEDKSFCNAYANPGAKWGLGMCNFATHKRIEKTKSAHKVNPLKASKRGAG